MSNEEFKKKISLEQKVILTIAEIYNTSYHEICDVGEKNIYCIYANGIPVPFCRMHVSTEEITESVLKQKVGIENSDYFFYELK